VTIALAIATPLVAWICVARALASVYRALDREREYLRMLRTATDLAHERIDLLVDRVNRLEASRCMCADCRSRSLERALTTWNPTKERPQS
jgi:hypothetical protein